MASSGNPADKQLRADPSFRFGIVTAEWHRDVTTALEQGARETLLNHGVSEANIVSIRVPGSFELLAGARFLVDHEKFNAVICLGCIIQGETRHFEFISQSVANALAVMSAQLSFPFIFGVLTTDTKSQALDRVGGRHGNKGVDAALAALEMAALKHSFKKAKGIGFGRS
ncbi:MAG: 6,7-dimethyl-8-ribityllumazine synthase [Bacteroidia bacterium]|nr:6,7-dimethyl-8-ribityllumazine synthase [Bacteroidia bacterium]MCZ2276589.1 6,7-dimethyl-8-ribityllumazine synthase [Bacteroidia bacterium]